MKETIQLLGQIQAAHLRETRQTLRSETEGKCSLLGRGPLAGRSWSQSMDWSKGEILTGNWLVFTMIFLGFPV